MESVFIPLYNEQTQVTASVEKIKKVLAGRDYEIVLVDDASTDDTPSICGELGKQDNVRYVRFDVGPTRRENLGKAMGECESERLAFTDCDLAADISIIPKMLDYLREYDIVIASRNLRDSRTVRKKWRNIFNRVANGFVRSYYKSRLTDHQCGLKAFRGDILRKLIVEAGYDKTHTRSWSWDTEILVRAQVHGYGILELPCSWRETQDTSVRVLRDWRMLPYFVKLKKRI